MSITYSNFPSLHNQEIKAILAGIDTGDAVLEDNTTETGTQFFTLTSGSIDTIQRILDNVPKDTFDTDVYTVATGDTEAISEYILVIYTENTDSYVDDEAVNALSEAKRVIKVNAKGKRRTKIQCKKGFKFTGKECKFIGGTERINKRKAIRKSILTRKSKGIGFKKKTARLSRIAKSKRKAMGLG